MKCATVQPGLEGFARANDSALEIAVKAELNHLAVEMVVVRGTHGVDVLVIDSLASLPKNVANVSKIGGLVVHVDQSYRDGERPKSLIIEDVELVPMRAILCGIETHSERTTAGDDGGLQYLLRSGEERVQVLTLVGRKAWHSEC